MNPPSGSPRVPAELVMRLRRETDLPVAVCRNALLGLSSEEQHRYVEGCERRHTSWLHDPIEDDPAVRPLLDQACEDAKRELEEWRLATVAEWDRREAAGEHVWRYRLGHGNHYWHLVKRIMRERHGIAWRSPADMNSGARFD